MQTDSASSSAVYVTEDPSTKDSTAEIVADLFTVNDSDFTIDEANSISSWLLVIILFLIPVPIIKNTIKPLFC